MSKPVYFVQYDGVWKMTQRRAKQFITACITGVGNDSATAYGKLVRRSTYFVDSYGYEGDRPAIVYWCEAREYHCFNFTDFDIDDWRVALLILEGREAEVEAGGENIVEISALEAAYRPNGGEE